MTKHSPLPWKLTSCWHGEWDDIDENFERIEGILILDCDGNHIATLPGEYGVDGEGMANAKLIIDAANLVFNNS